MAVPFRTRARHGDAAGLDADQRQGRPPERRHAMDLLALRLQLLLQSLHGEIPRGREDEVPLLPDTRTPLRGQCLVRAHGGRPCVVDRSASDPLPRTPAYRDDSDAERTRGGAPDVALRTASVRSHALYKIWCPELAEHQGVQWHRECQRGAGLPLRDGPDAGQLERHSRQDRAAGGAGHLAQARASPLRGWHDRHHHQRLHLPPRLRRRHPALGRVSSAALHANGHLSRRARQRDFRTA